MNRKSEAVKKNLSAPFVLPVALLFLLPACAVDRRQAPGEGQNRFRKFGLLIVAHGSPEREWNERVSEICNHEKLLLLEKVEQQRVQVGFMEFACPTVAESLKEFEGRGFTDIVVVPLLLAESSHYYDDLPYLLGQSFNSHTGETMQEEGLEGYTGRLHTILCPPLNRSGVLASIALKRYRELTRNAKDEALILVAHGCKMHDWAWQSMLRSIGDEVKRETNVARVQYLFLRDLECVRMKSLSGEIEQDAWVVVPLMLAEGGITRETIPSALGSVKGKDILYSGRTLLPDDSIADWIVSIFNSVKQHYSMEKGGGRDW